LFTFKGSKLYVAPITPQISKQSVAKITREFFNAISSKLLSIDFWKESKFRRFITFLYMTCKNGQ
jgi:hypothetical protein